MGGRGAGLGVRSSKPANQTGAQYIANFLATGDGGKPVTPYSFSLEQGWPTWTDDNNPEVLKYQSQDDDKLANFLAKVDKTTDLSNYPDKWGFHDNPFQKLVLNMGLNKEPIKLSDADFRKYVKQTGATVMYRGWSGSDAADRFVQSQYNHTGTGIYGDGLYFTPSRSTAKSYGSVVTKMALSPTARVISYTALQTQYKNLSPKLRRALSIAGGSASGSNGTRSYGGNDGQAQLAMKLGYNVVDMGGGYLYALTRDAFVVSDKRL